ncbi:MAG: TrkH family potassium uptake protein [Desulfurivibrionaceae bacterium]|nr:TrkH family potassium uptake protein [Desulfurivibrionaceae bacterium]
MRTGGVFNILGKLLILISLCLLMPIPFSLYFKDGMTATFLLSAGIGAILGLLLLALFAPEKDLGYRDGFAVVVLSWLGLAFLGALPFYFSGKMPLFVDCFFESMSGFTTTGSTVLTEVEILPHSILFWRAMTHWLGGMGIIVLSLAILPLLGVGGMQLFQAEVAGPTKDRLTPRIQDTARILWGVYFLFTAVQTVLLLWGGMSFFDAICHSFATLSSGGFSTHSASVGYFNSVFIEAVIICFMFLAGTNFSLHHQALRGKFTAYWRNEEFRLYLLLVILSVSIIIILNLYHRTYATTGETIRTALFQVTSIITCTGFGTADFDQWPPALKILLVALMFVGGSAGSTSGGMKIVRILLFFKYARLQLHNLVHPRTIGTLKYGKAKVPPEVMVGILGFLALYIGVFLIGSLLVAATGIDIVSSTTAVITAMANVGPGLNLVGPAQHFGHLPPLAKGVLSFCMLAGRLELYTVAVLLTPDFWQMARKPVWRWQMAKAPSPSSSTPYRL